MTKNEQTNDQINQTRHSAQRKMERAVQREVRRETGQTLTLAQTRNLINLHQQVAIQKQNDIRNGVLQALREVQPGFIADGKGLRGVNTVPLGDTTALPPVRRDGPSDVVRRSPPPMPIEESFLGHVCVMIDDVPTDYIARIHGSLVEPA